MESRFRLTKIEAKNALKNSSNKFYNLVPDSIIETIDNNNISVVYTLYRDGYSEN